MNPTSIQAGTSTRERKARSSKRALPSVSVVVSAERRDGLESLLANLAAQSFPPCEVLVTGASERAAEEQSTWRASGVPQGIPNTGNDEAPDMELKFDQCSGEFIQFLHVSDFLSLNHLECQAQALDEQKADLAYGPWIWNRTESPRTIMHDRVFQSRPFPPGRALVKGFLHEWSLSLTGCLFRRSFLQDTFPPNLPAGVDPTGHLLGRTLLKSPRAVFTGETLALRGTKTGVGHKEGSVISALDRAHLLRTFIDECGKDPAKESLLGWPFSFHVGQTLRSLSGTDPKTEAVRQHLRDISQRLPAPWVMLGRLGLSPLHLSGRRTPGFPAPVNNHQVRLLEELGYVLAG